MTISNTEKKRFRQIGHGLNPIVTIAQKGYTENIREELDRALNDHELIKVRLAVGDREVKRELTEAVCGDLGAECVQSIGHVVLLYREAKKPNPKLSNLKRELAP